MLRNKLILCVFVLASWAKEVKESRVVNIAQGPVRGYKDQASGIYAFRNIPYASVPTGPNRFKAPLPAPIWMQPLEAIGEDISCPQATFEYPGKADIKEQEDCLLASVYVPVTTEDKPLPVVVYVHGGAFQMGFGNMIIPRELVNEHDIIAVTFNYRLGVHGFLCLGTEDVPGNAGLKDQVALLRWVQKNIASFGGNPDDVTIAGYSAGSAAVDLLMLSKSAEGLFNKVIPESGANTAAFTVQVDPLETAKWFAKTLNFTDVENIHALEIFYKTISFEILTSNAFFTETDATFKFSACVERPSGEEVFLDKSPVDILKSGNYRKVPMLYGFANMEGLLRINLFDHWKHMMNEKFSDFMPADLQFESDEQKEKVAQEIKEFYFGDKPVGEDNILGYVNFFSDTLFTYSTLSSVKYHVGNGHDQVYLYEYSFVDESTPFVPHTKVKGSDHCTQTYAVFNGKPYTNQKPTEEFRKMSKLIRKIWASFIKTGKPVPAESPEVPQWPAVGKNWSPHMSLGNEITLRGSLLEARKRFWESIYSKHYRNPKPPPKPSASRSEL